MSGSGSMSSGSSAVSPVPRRLADAASDLDGCGGSAPGAIDAGPATAVISGMVVTLTKAAAALSQGLSAGSQAVAQAGKLADEADARIGSTFSAPANQLAKPIPGTDLP